MSDRLPQVVLPGLRVAHAREAFRKAVRDSDDPQEWFDAVIDTLEEGASRWGNACPECRTLLVTSLGTGGRYVCPVGHDLTSGSSLLIAWEPVR